MEEIIDTTFYRDDEDFLTRTLTSSVLYPRKNNLNISLVENNNNTDKTNEHFNNEIYKNKEYNKNTNQLESPNLDFLKLASPDLEQILFNINDDGDNSTTTFTNESETSYDFTLEDELSSTDNYLTDALQELHDKESPLPDLSLFDVSNAGIPVTDNVIQENHREKTLVGSVHGGNLKHVSRKNRASNKITKLGKSNLMRCASGDNPAYHGAIRSNMRNNRQVNLLGNSGHLNIPVNNPPLPIGGNQMVYNNNIDMMTSQHMNQGISHLHHKQQQQQEIAFLSHAMGYHPEGRENIHMINQNNSQLQQKFLEQQMLQHHLNGGHDCMSGGLHQMSHANHVTKIPYFHSLGLDDETLKMFIENPQLAPINLEIQEMVKRERKKLRNRIASSKCRKRKLEREGKLEDKVKDLKEKNIELNAIANALKQQICDLKQRVMDHVGEGCQIVLPSV